MPCTPPTSVRTTPPQSGPTLSLLLNVTVQVRSPHTPWSAQGCRALPCECAHHPLASQSGQHHHQCFKCNPSSPRITCTECWGDIRLLLLLTLMTVLKVYYVHEWIIKMETVGVRWQWPAMCNVTFDCVQKWTVDKTWLWLVTFDGSTLFTNKFCFLATELRKPLSHVFRLQRRNL